MAQPPPIDSDLRPREFGIALLMAATWYFAGPWGILPTIWFLYTIANAPPTWLGAGVKLLPIAPRRALTTQTQRLQAGWAQLSAPWREDDAPSVSLPKLCRTWYTGQHKHSYVALWEKERVIGIIYVDEDIKSGAFNANDLDLLAALGNYAAVAIEPAAAVCLRKVLLGRSMDVDLNSL